LYRVITRGEAGFTVMTKAKQQSFQWKMKSKVKSMLIIFFGIKEICVQRICPG
jgi:hypothetical protein